MWALHKHFPNVKIYVRAHDVMHGLNLEKVGTQANLPLASKLAGAPRSSRDLIYIRRAERTFHLPDACNMRLSCNSVLLNCSASLGHAEVSIQACVGNSCTDVLAHAGKLPTLVTHVWSLWQAGATAVVPETLEPSLQLASAVLSQLNMPPDDVQEAIQEFRRAHMGELQVGALVLTLIA